MGTDLKELLDALGDVVGKMPDTALWILFGVGIFKLTIYLSTTGSIFFILKLVIDRGYSLLTTEGRPARVNIGFYCKNKSYAARIEAAIRSIQNNAHGDVWMGENSVKWLEQAIQEKRAKDNENKS